MKEPENWAETEEKIRNKICLNCGRKLQKALECKNFHTGKWDGHNWKCECSPGIYLAEG